MRKTGCKRWAVIKSIPDSRNQKSIKSTIMWDILEQEAIQDSTHLGFPFDCFREFWKVSCFVQKVSVFSSSPGKLTCSGTSSTIFTLPNIYAEISYPLAKNNRINNGFAQTALRKDERNCTIHVLSLTRFVTSTRLPLLVRDWSHPTNTQIY